MSGVLHLQSRAYPLHYSAPNLSFGPLVVPGHGELRPVAGELRSLAYNPEATIEIDLTEMTGSAITLPGTEIVGCHARILTGGTVLVVYALRHEADLRQIPLPDLDALDARINDTLRRADAPILSAVLAASVTSGLVRDLRLRPDRRLGGELSPVDRRSVRYNCHFVTQDPPWAPDPRIPLLPLGPACKVLLPFTYAWDRSPATSLSELMTLTEPTDIAVAQQSLLTSAVLGGGRILVDLAGADPSSADVHMFRRFLDGVWANYHHLDSYRIESAQDHRATYLAARQVIGLDDTQARADTLLSYVNNSLLASAAHRTEELDTRLNRVASALTVVASAAFGLDIAAFLLPDHSWSARLAAVVGVIALAAAGLFAVIRTRRPGARPS